MALDPRIPLQAQTPDLLSAVQKGLGISQSIRQQPLREALMRQQAEQQAFSLQQAQQNAPLQSEMLKAQLAQLQASPEQLANKIAIQQQQIALEQESLRQRDLERQQRQQQFESKQGELKPGVQKILDAAQTEATESAARARQLGFLAEDILSAGDIGGGSATTFTEFLKQRLGTQDDVTELRRRYNAIRSSEAVQNLPPGVASDKDIELALKGFPAENAPASQLVSFLRGAQKLAQFRSEYNRIKSQVISEQGSTRNLLIEIDARMPDLFEGDQQSRSNLVQSQEAKPQSFEGFKIISVE